MQPRLLSLTAAVLFWQSLSPAAHAQLVQVSPGYVRAPFVRVYWGAGGSHVRAPFVDVYSPRYRAGYVADDMQARNDFSQASWQDLNRTIREASAQLDADLNRFPSGAFWQSSLRTAEIAELVPADSDNPPTEDVRYRFQELANTYNTVGGAPEVNRIVNLTSFQDLRAALNEYSMLPENRVRRQLFLAAGDLNRSLQRFETAAGWQQYLGLAPGLVLFENQIDNPQLARSADDLANVLSRFDSANKNEEYRVITALPAFQRTQERLTAYLAQGQTPSSAHAEELPTPMPDEQ